MATTVDEILVRIDGDMQGLRKELGDVERRLNTSVKRHQKAASSIGNAFRKLGPIIGTALAGVAIKSIVDVAVNAERLEIQLGYLFNSAEEGSRAFQVMAEYASTVPFSLQQIEAAAQPLAAVAKDADELQALLKLTGDVAAVTGLSFQDTALQLQRSFTAGIGAADMFRDRGVNALLGFQQGAQYSVEETIQKFDEAFGEGGRFNGSADALADTFEGTMSMIGDSMFNLKKDIGEAGFFDALKDEVQGFDEAIKGNDATVKAFADNMGKLLAFLTRITARAIEGMVGAFNDLFNFARGFADAMENEDALTFLNMTLAEVTERGRRLHEQQLQIADSASKAADAIEGEATASLGLKDLSASKGSGVDEKEVAKADKAIVSLTNANKLLRMELKGASEAQLEFERQTQKLTEITPQQEADLITLSNAHADLKKKIEEKNAAEEEADKKREDRLAGIEATTEKINELTFENELLKKSADGATDAEIEFERILQALPHATEKQIEALRKLHEENQRLQEDTEELTPMMESVVSSFESAGRSVSDSLANAFMNGQSAMESFKDITRNLVSQIISNFLRLSVINPIINSLFGFGSGSPNALPTMGTKASGGSVNARVPQLVGERGPELFVPHSAGSVLNNMNTQNALAGGGPSVIVHQNINVETGVSQTVRAEMISLLPQIQESTISAVIDSRQRGGAVATAFGA